MRDFFFVVEVAAAAAAAAAAASAAAFCEELISLINELWKANDYTLQ